MTFDEHELVMGCRHNDRVSQRRLYDAFAGRMMVVCLRYVKSRDEAEDILQESFIKIFEKIGTFRFECPLGAWVKRIVVNTTLNYLRDNRRYRFAEELETVQDTVELTSTDELHWKDLLQVVQQLPAGCRTVFNLYAIEGYQHQEIAELLGISEGTSKSQYSRAKGLLQRILYTEKNKID
ncbi:MAG: RNA polymerase sigma factor [Siphonobacter sp.]